MVVTDLREPVEVGTLSLISRLVSRMEDVEVFHGFHQGHIVQYGGALVTWKGDHLQSALPTSYRKRMHCVESSLRHSQITREIGLLGKQSFGCDYGFVGLHEQTH